jgi:hypothetical protein
VRHSITWMMHRKKRENRSRLKIKTAPWITIKLTQRNTRNACWEGTGYSVVVNIKYLCRKKVEKWARSVVIPHIKNFQTYASLSLDWY